MSFERDPELDDLFEDPGLADFANSLHALKADEPPLDSAFRSALRRQLMQKAWEMTEGRVPWWRRLASPSGLAWSGAAVGMVLIASVVVFMTTQGPGGDVNQVLVTSAVADAKAVQLAQPIPLAFNQAMDHPSTEAAVQVRPATQVTYTWQANTLYVQPTGGGLAPNTQYQVTVGPGAKTAAGQTVAAPQTVRFVTQSAPSPAPTPPPTPSTLLTNVKKLVSVSPGARPVWSLDASTIYLQGADGSLESIDANTGSVKVLVTGGVSSTAIAPAGDRLAYVRNGAIEILTLATATTTELSLKAPAVAVSWVAGKITDRLIWATQDGIYDQDQKGEPEKLAAIPGLVGTISIAPDGHHAVLVKQGELLDLATGRLTPIGPFLDWSPDGARLMYRVDSGVVIADMDGIPVVTLPSGNPSWSARNEILIGGDTDLYQVRPDGTGLTKLADGTFNSPVWAPDSIHFSFVRSGSLWAGQAPAPVAPPSALDQATQVVNSFMQARLDGNQDKATTFLDSAGKTAYGVGGPSLLVTGSPAFSRFYILTSEESATDSNSVRLVVRLVLAKDKIDVSQFDEALTLTRRESTDPILVHDARAGARRDLGKGPEVVSVDITQDQVTVTFDSDLNATTVPASVMIRDSHGKPLVGGITTYANHKVTITGLQLTAGVNYTLTVSTSLSDVNGRAVASEYDLDIFGLSTAPNPTPVTPSPTPSTPSPTPSTPSPTSSP